MKISHPDGVATAGASLASKQLIMYMDLESRLSRAEYDASIFKSTSFLKKARNIVQFSETDFQCVSPSGQRPRSKCSRRMPTSTPRKRPRASRNRPPTNNNIVDLIGGSSRADEALGNNAPEDAWTSLANTIDNLATRSLPPRDSLSGPSATQNLAPTQTLAAGHTEVNGIPPDRTLKTALKISTQQSLAWTKFRGQGEEYSALAAYVIGGEVTGPPVGSDAAGDPEEDVTIARRRFYRGLLNFRHPLDIGTFSTRWQAGVSGRDADITRRIQAWQISLQSLFYGFKHGLVPQFYLILPSTVVLFTRSPDAVVWFSRGTAGIRSLLSEYCVEFRVRGDAEDPCVIVEGNDNVQATYSFIFSAGSRLSGATDVPVLLADVPFRGGTVVSAEIGVVSEASAIGQEGSQFSVTLSGLFLPRQVEDIVEGLKLAQGKFIANVEAEKRGKRLNICEAKEENGVPNGDAHSSLSVGVIARIIMDGGEFKSITKDFD